MTPIVPDDCPREDCPYDARIRRLEVEAAISSSSAEQLQTAVESLNEVVHDLRDTINKGRGAVWVLIAISGAVGAVVTAILGFFKTNE